MKCVIEKMDHQGRGISFIDGKITFIENALPNEVVDIDITNEKKKFNEGIVKTYIEKSKDRIVPKCKYYDVCGGCNLMHLSYKKQLEYKENKVKDILKRYANYENVNSIIGSNDELNYRNKITLKINKKMGYYKRKSNDIVYIDECKLANNKINKIIKDLNNINEFDNIYEVAIRDINETDTALTLYINKDSKYPKITEYAALNNIKLNKIIRNKTNIIKDKSKILGKLSNFTFIISPLAFFQVNTSQTVKLYNKVVEYLEPKKDENVMDLYCGTGTIGIYVSPHVKKVFGVEICKEAIEDAKKNVALNNITNAEFVCGDTEKVIRKVKANFDSVIVDPPRSGLTNGVIEDLFRINPNKIVYVSCDPITLARDLKILSQNYEICEVTPFDMFPNTYHVETIVKLKKII